MNQSDYSGDLHSIRINCSTPLNSKNKRLQLNLKSVDPEKTNSPSSRAFYFGTFRSTSNNGTFIPFVHERDGLGRLLNASQRVESKQSPKAKDTPVNFASSPKGYRILENHGLQISKRNKNNLNNILNMDSEMIEAGDISQANATQLNGFFGSPRQENSGAQTCRNYTQFKLNISASQKNMITKKQNLLDSRMKNSPKERLSSSRLRPDPIFLSQSREEIEQLKARNISQYPNLGYYDTTKLHVIKPKLRNVLFGKAESSRGEPLQKEESLVSLSLASERSRNNNKMPGLDFTRQTFRETKDNYWNKINSDKKVVDTKNLDEIERDFQFSKQLKKKYDLHKIPYPHGAKLNPNSIPLEPHKLNETAKGYMRLYNLIQGGHRCLSEKILCCCR